MESRIVKRPDGGTEVHCAECDTTLTWFTYHNVWLGGRVAYHLCSKCYLATEDIGESLR
jgi:hypothetical protein